MRTPLVRLRVDDAPAEIWLQARDPAADQLVQDPRRRATRSAAPTRRACARGLVTASAGNMAQGVAWIARELGLPATIAVPEHAPQAKLDAIARLGGRVLKVPYDDWWEAIVTQPRRRASRACSCTRSPDPAVMAGNGTIGLEILEDLPDVDAVVIPLRRRRPGDRHRERAARAAARRRASTRSSRRPAPRSPPRMRAGEPVDVDYRPSFVDGSGSRRVLDDDVAARRAVVDDALVADDRETAEAVRTLARRLRVIAEGAGALATAAALAGQAGGGRVVAVVSGGNIDFATLARILEGETPT